LLTKGRKEGRKEGRKKGSEIYDTSHVGRIKELMSGNT
jgi:hypothetical protein